MSDSASTYVSITVDPDPGFPLMFNGLTATEELGRPFLITMNLSSGQARGNINALLGASLTVTMTAAGGQKQYFNGIVTRAGFTGRSGGAYRYYVELRPWIWLLRHTTDCKIYQKAGQTIYDIIDSVFTANEFSAKGDNRKNQGGSEVLEYCVQYRESAFDFVTRLMEQYGLYYYFEHADGEHKLMICDDPTSHTSIGAALPFYFGQTEQRAVEDHVWEWTSDLQLTPGSHSYRDYDFTKPDAQMTTTSQQPGDYQHGSLEVYDYPGIYTDLGDGQRLSDLRMQAHKARGQVFDGQSNARAIRAGVKVKLKSTADRALEQEYLVIRAVTTVTMAEGLSQTGGQLVDSHRVKFSAIPGATPFRLEPVTHRPTIRGAQTARVVGNSGDEVTTDAYGRIKVKFPWDRSKTADENSSCWIRVAQSWAGAKWGTMFIPRIGMEVVVVFLEGNPDRPLVTGVVYNANQQMPYALPGQKTRSYIKTNSSPGGDGGYNELRFEDAHGSEEISVQAQKNYTKLVKNNDTATINSASTITVGGDRTITVQKGAHSLTVQQKDQTVTITKGDHTLTVTAGSSTTTTGKAFSVTANTSISLTANESISLTAKNSISLTVGSNSVTIDTTGVSVSGTKIAGSAKTQMALDGGLEMALTGTIIKIN
jgi:type VI secretion system secreted protein VgrG